MNLQKILELADDAFDVGETGVLCTVVRLDGSGYGRPGARLLLTDSGRRQGYISGGCLEKDLCRRVWDATRDGDKLIAFDTRGNSVRPSRYRSGCEGVVYVLCQRVDRKRAAALDILRDVERVGQETKLLTIYRSESSAFSIGEQWTQPPTERLSKSLIDRFNRCTRNGSIEFQDKHGNSVEGAVEILRPRRRIIIFGAGDDVIPVAAAATSLGWHTTVVGHRPELADATRFPNANVVCGPMRRVAKSLTIGQATDVVVMTHDFDRDVHLVPAILDSPARSIGLLGPKRRLANLVAALYQSGRALSDDEIRRIRSPIGLDIGAISPEEIAMSIIAELVAMPTHRNGQSLHQRASSLHEPSPHWVASSDFAAMSS